MDPLEDFIQKNRTAFDDASPPAHLWHSLEGRLDRHRSEKNRSHLRWYRIRQAAAAAALILLGATAGRYYAELASRPDSLGEVSPEYAELERFYRKEIERRTRVLAAAHQDRHIQTDLSELEILYEELRRELPVTTPEEAERIIQAMIVNYQTRIDLLEMVLEKIQLPTDSTQKKQYDEISL